MTERKRPRRTRERILETSLALFNRLGEPNVTTGDIALEMGISPGNLYYHFRNKDDITAELCAALVAELDPVLGARSERPLDVEDLWLWLHLLLEAMLRYRFLLRDLLQLGTGNARVGKMIVLILEQGESALREILLSLRKRGELVASDGELHALARNAMLIVMHSTGYDRLAGGPAARQREPDLSRAAHYVLMLIAPHVTGSSRTLLERLSAEYANGHREPHP